MELNLSLCAVLALRMAGHVRPYFYLFRDGRWFFTSDGVEFFLFDDLYGVKIVDNPFGGGGLTSLVS